jgi:hypothetical protein
VTAEDRVFNSLYCTLNLISLGTHVAGLLPHRNTAILGKLPFEFPPIPSFGYFETKWVKADEELCDRYMQFYTPAYIVKLNI